MDTGTNVQELKQLVKDFCEEREWDQFHSPKDLAIGIATESSELLAHFRFKSLEESKRLLDSEKREEIEEEIADVFYFVLRLCQLYDIDLTNALKVKMEKNKIKYPINRAKGSNKKYNELSP